MLYRREGWPEDDELVLCTVTGIQPHCVFAKLDEYDKTGLIHISEISPGRVRNIREHVSENEKIVCKILRVDKDKGHIDLSLRRVNDGQKRNKLNEIKQETLAEKIVEHLAHKEKLVVEEVYNKITDSVFKKYPALFPCFKDVADDKVALLDLGVDKKYAEFLTAEIKNRLVAEDVTLKGTLSLHSTASDGVEQVRSVLLAVEEANSSAEVRYLGNGNYIVGVKGPDFKSAQRVLDSLGDLALQKAKALKMLVEFKRQE